MSGFPRLDAGHCRGHFDAPLAETNSIYDFGIPHAIELDDRSVFIRFYATQLDHVMHQRYARIEV